MPEVLILTGPPGSGKSTAARALAERYDRVAHVEASVLRGFVAPTGRGPSEARDRLHALGVRNACAVARNFLAERMAPDQVESVYRRFEAAGAFAGATIDSSDLTPYETADRLQALTTSGASLVWRP